MSQERPTSTTKDRPSKTVNGVTVDTNKPNGDEDKTKKSTQ